jgi:hypothetical protein
MKRMLISWFLLSPLLLGCAELFQKFPSTPANNSLSTPEISTIPQHEASTDHATLRLEKLGKTGGAQAQFSTKAICAKKAADFTWILPAWFLASSTEIALPAAVHPELESLREKLCSTADIAAFELQALLVPYLSRIAPVCSWQWESAQGFACTHKPDSQTLSQHDVQALKKSFLAQWARPPYLLMRRLTMLDQLGEIASNAASQRQALIKQFCEGLEHSLPEEKPLVISSPLWRHAYCQSADVSLQDRAYSLALSYGLSELKFFQQVATVATRKGHLSLKIPPTDLHDKELWMKLEPEADVSTGIWKIALQERGISADLTPEALSKTLAPGWHPLFSISNGGYPLAVVLSLVPAALSGKSAPVGNINPKDQSAGARSIAHYLSTTLLGETSFSVSNGYAKILQLPLGTYRYTLYDAPQDEANWAPIQTATKVTHGTISWQQVRPHPVIAQWHNSNTEKLVESAQ